MNTADFTDGDRQALALALAHLRYERPGWDYYLGGLATKLDLDESYKFFIGLGEAMSEHRSNDQSANDPAANDPPGWKITKGAPLLAIDRETGQPYFTDGTIKVKRLRKTVGRLNFDECLELIRIADPVLFTQISDGVANITNYTHDTVARTAQHYETIIRARLQELYDQHVLGEHNLPQRGTLPTKAYDGDAGWDFYSDIDLTIGPQQYGRIPTGIAIELPPGYCAAFRDRSSMGGKGIHLFGGVLDYGYRDEVHVVLCNHNPVAYNIRRGDRVAQALILPVPHFHIVEVDQLSPTQRGTRGFGSSGA